MGIRRRPFPDRFAILPSDAYRFGAANADGQPFTVVARRTMANRIEVVAVNAGLLARVTLNSADLSS